ncbi:hypothetical protein [Paraburkholderia dinghuensis]|uniref:Uncharacterized protein n=1 Tax=Paraburkholderia dinghuensis TaxID=2305225 RepID=A0A3N6MQA0_9BURK|nr:hypothetical protein [Paraburkholderia dinghuensis]RQG99830.1 hypothetical protein D1Y85_26015 [Paraburkholderia dinghuensis]
MSDILFPNGLSLGTIHFSTEAQAAAQATADRIGDLTAREVIQDVCRAHSWGDWGDVPPSVSAWNEHAILTGQMVVSQHSDCGIVVVTNGARTKTMVLGEQQLEAIFSLAATSAQPGMARPANQTNKRKNSTTNE